MSISCVILLIVEAVLGQAKAPLPPTIDEIIRDVRDHELAKRDFEVRLIRNYSLAPGIAGSFTEVLRSQKEIHWVSQGTRRRLRKDESWVDTEGKNSRSEQLISFDGANTRIVNSAGELIEAGRGEDFHWLSSELFLYPLRDGARLSNWLKHGESYGTPSHGDYRHDVEFESFESVDGVACVRVVLSTTSRNHDQWFHRWRFWLATDRGYSIARVESIKGDDSKAVVSAEGKVTKWLAMSDGTWIPSEGFVTKYEFSPEGARKPRWTEQFVVRSASLTPKYPDSFFSEVAKALKPVE